MRDLNKIFLMGRLGNDPTLRTTKTGIAVATFSLATKRVKKEEETPETTDGTTTEAASSGETKRERNEDTTWHRVVVWGKQGQNCAQYLKKGHSALVEGSVRTNKYTDTQGIERYTFEVQADAVRFIGGGKRVKAEEGVLIAAEA
jgi:single-strand DNA-binding protein